MVEKCDVLFDQEQPHPNCVGYGWVVTFNGVGPMTCHSTMPVSASNPVL